MPPVPRRLAQDRNHLIGCGDDALAYRVVEELTTNYGDRVTVLLSARLGVVFLTLFGVSRTGLSGVLARSQSGGAAAPA